MNNTKHLLLLVIFLISNFIQAQDKLEDKTNSKLSFIMQGALGYATIENDREPNYNLSSVTGEFLINFSVDQDFGFATGIALSQLSGNGFNTIGNFFHERSVLKVPLLVTFTNEFSDSFTFYSNFGVYGQNIVNDEYRFLNNFEKNIYEGWNFGLQGSAGFIFNVNKTFSLGLVFSGQSDFSNFKTNSNVGINDEQKIESLISYGMIFQIRIPR